MGNFTTVPDVVVGQSFPPSLWEAAIMNNLNLGVYRQLGETILGAPGANITFSSIPQTFAHLIIVFYGRSAGGTTGDTLVGQFNGDTTANYDSYEFVGSLSTVAGTSMKVAGMSGTSAPANAFGGAYIVIPHYTQSANQKFLLSLTAGKIATTAPIAQSGIYYGSWRSSAAINQILIQASGNLAAGSRATLYGLPA